MPKNNRQLKAGEQSIEEEEKKEPDAEREWAALEMMAREYDPQTTVENYSTVESEYGARYTNKRFTMVHFLNIIFSSELDMPWCESLFDGLDHRFESFKLDQAQVLN